tara:strand:+ start:467 stop:1150 length:684 start_codon:yes stop_codon:yes gene_type:complete
MKFRPSSYSNPGIRMGAGPPTGQYYVSLLAGRGASPDGWHWGILKGRVPETVKIKGPLVPGQKVQFKKLTGNTAIQWAVFKARKKLLAHGGGPGMGPGLVSHDAASWHPGVRVVVPPAAAFHVNPQIPPALPGDVWARAEHTSYTPPPSKTAGLTKGLGTALGIGGVALIPLLIIGVIALPTFVIGPFVMKAVAPKWSYGRRLAASLGVGMAVGTTTMLIKTARGKE